MANEWAEKPCEEVTLQTFWDFIFTFHYCAMLSFYLLRAFKNWKLFI